MGRVEEDVGGRGDHVPGGHLVDLVVVVLEPLAGLGREAVSRVVASLHAAEVVADGEQIVAPVSVELSVTRCHVLAEVDAREPEVDEVLLLPPEAVVEESDKLNGQDLRELDDVELLDAVALSATTRASVGDDFRLKILLNALVQGEPVSGRELQRQLEERLVLDGGPRASFAGQAGAPLAVEQLPNEGLVGALL